MGDDEFPELSDEELEQLSPGQIEMYFEALRRHLLPSDYVPHRPSPKQARFLSLVEREALFGGAAGGGKSDALLMAAVQYVEVPGYSALLLRNSWPDLNQPNAIMARSHDWFRNVSGLKWNQRDHMWTFPSNATLKFGYLKRDDDVNQYKSAEFQFIGFDELTTFTENQYTFMFSRLRRSLGSGLDMVPLRIRSATNPGPPGHEWVMKRFRCDHEDAKEKGIVRTFNQDLYDLIQVEEDRIFLPSYLSDNPGLDRKEYMASLANLDPVTREQLLNGDWTARHEGSVFRVDKEFPTRVNLLKLERVVKWVRWWDFAWTPGAAGDYTVGALLGLTNDQQIVVADIIRFRGGAEEVESKLIQTAHADGKRVTIGLEQELGGAGKLVAQWLVKKLIGFNVKAVKPTGNKQVRAAPFAAYWNNGLVCMVEGPWNKDFLNECSAFPLGSHDDQVDAASAAFDYLHGANADHGPPPHAGGSMQDNPWKD